MKAPDAEHTRDAEYIDALLAGIRAIRSFQPMFGKGQAVSLDQFKALYGADPLYHWVGFDSELMYAAHRAGGAMTSLYRNLGTGCEHLFQRILRDRLRLTSDQLKWEYVVGAEDLPTFEGDRDPVIHVDDIQEVSGASEDLTPLDSTTSKPKGKKNSLDGRIDVDDLRGGDSERVGAWLEIVRTKGAVTWQPRGAVFEVRQGYKSMDAKRQAADMANAAQALTRQRLPILTIFSNQIDDNLIKRYTLSGWSILRGITAGDGRDDATRSTYAFMRDVVGFDLAAFFVRNTDAIRTEVTAVLDAILSPR